MWTKVTQNIPAGHSQEAHRSEAQSHLGTSLEPEQDLHRSQKSRVNPGLLNEQKLKTI